MKRKHKKVTTISSILKYFKRDYLSPKEEHKIADFLLNLKIIIITLSIAIILIWLLNMFGCFEARMGNYQ